MSSICLNNHIRTFPHIVVGDDYECSNKEYVALPTDKGQQITVALTASGVPFKGSFDKNSFVFAYDNDYKESVDEIIENYISEKYDRFSRNMREYLNITDELDRYRVTVYSFSEPFNTETKEGRMMRNKLLNFAEMICDIDREIRELHRHPLFQKLIGLKNKICDAGVFPRIGIHIDIA